MLINILINTLINILINALINALINILINVLITARKGNGKATVRHGIARQGKATHGEGRLGMAMEG